MASLLDSGIEDLKQTDRGQIVVKQLGISLWGDYEIRVSRFDSLGKK